MPGAAGFQSAIRRSWLPRRDAPAKKAVTGTRQLCRHTLVGVLHRWSRFGSYSEACRIRP